MLQTKQFISIVLFLILGVVLSQGAVAQQKEDSAVEVPASDPEQTDNSVDKGKLVVTMPAPPPPIDASMILEEVVVTAARVEGGGNRRRTAAGRKDLDGSDQTDMEGFFDDIDGLSTLGGDDEGNAFSLNGLSPDLSKVTLDGQGFGQGRGSGGLGAGDLPTDMILRVDIFKTPTAAMEEGGSGGLVNLQMRSPLDIPRSSSSIRGKLAYVPDKGNFSPSANFFFGRPSENKTFGYMLSVNLDDRTREYGSQIVSSWELQEFDGRSAFIPRQIRSDAVKIGETRALGSIVLGFRPHESLEISGKLILSQQQKDTESHSLQHRLEKQRDITALAFDDRIVSELVSSDRNRRNLRISSSKREDEIESRMLTMDFIWRHKRWRLEGVAGYGVDENASHKPSQGATFDANNAFGYLANQDGSLAMYYPDGFPPRQDYTLGRINLSDRSTRDTNGFGGIDVIRGLGQGLFRRVRFGAKLREMTRSRTNSTGKTDQGDDLTLDNFFTGQYQKTPWDTVVWPSADMNEVNATIQESEIVWKENLLNEYDIKRQTDAGYLQTDFRASLKENRFLIGNIGLRIVDTKTWIDGYQNRGEGL
ncbi:MAG: TonB-dependent receptor plug domain-containing protein, partial [Gammaproteobacteria bacterium]|nr:TonB-dependent receptor plug domain-containing protein [Gammaproteobacteria bacterium]